MLAPDPAARRLADLPSPAGPPNLAAAGLPAIGQRPVPQALVVLWEASDRTRQRGLVANRVPRYA